MFMALTLASTVPVAFAQTDDHSAHQPPPATELEASPPVAHQHGTTKADAVQENMKKIEELMQQIQQAAEPARKRELLHQHLQAMQKQIGMVLGQREPMKMSMKDAGRTDAAGADGAGKEGGMMKGGGGMVMHKKIEQRIDMAERMLQQMIEREAVEAELSEQ
jgi:hypothetical protein